MKTIFKLLFFTTLLILSVSCDEQEIQQVKQTQSSNLQNKPTSKDPALNSIVEGDVKEEDCDDKLKELQKEPEEINLNSNTGCTLEE